MTFSIIEVKGRQILDSRGNPTVEAEITLDSGDMAIASVPSGASTGSKEAHELRDGNNALYNGKSVLNAVENINTTIGNELVGMDPYDQRYIDFMLRDLDGTDNKSNLGANAILATSLAVAKVAAQSRQLPLYRYIGGISACRQPIPLMNLLNGGAHANNGLDIQEFMIVPLMADNISNAIQIGTEIFHALKKIIGFQNYSTAVGDEGGFAPNISNTREALDLLVQAIESSGYKIGEEILIALDVAATELYKDNKYHIDGLSLGQDELIQFYAKLVEEYPIISIEDPFAETDYEGWKNMTQALGYDIQIVGDDLFVTNIELLLQGIQEDWANSILIKPNQIGTLTETLDTIDFASSNGYKAIISHRSGETEDSTIAHIAVGTNAGQIKTGSLSRTDRLAKYNELLRIDEDLKDTARYGF